MERKMDIAVCQKYNNTAVPHPETVEMINTMLTWADKRPLSQLVGQSHRAFENAAQGTVHWESYWAGVIHGITLAACSGEPRFLESINGFEAEEKAKGTIQ